MTTYLVTGATGHFGKATIDFLLAKGIPATNIAALVRDESKAQELKNKGVQLRTGDYNDPAALKAAFQGIDKLLLVSGTDIENRQKQHENAVQAAKEAGVKHLIYTSFVRKNETESNPLGPLAQSHMATDKAIKASGIPYTILLNSLYADALPLFIGNNVKETGIFFPAGDGKTAFTLRTDLAEAAANVLAGTGHENREYVLASPEKNSFHDIAQSISELNGVSITYTSPGQEVFKDALTQAGVPPVYIGISAAFAEAIHQGEFDVPSSDLEQLLGRKATPLKEYLKAAYA
jgi:NAD(P)H dehydrogenase (quinone)